MDREPFTLGTVADTFTFESHWQPTQLSYIIAHDDFEGGVNNLIITLTNSDGKVTELLLSVEVEGHDSNDDSPLQGSFIAMFGFASMVYIFRKRKSHKLN